MNFRPRALFELFYSFFNDDYSFVFFVISVPIFHSQIVLLPLFPGIRLFSCILHLLVGRNIFHYFGIFNIICIAWPSLSVFKISFLSPITTDSSLQVVLSDLSAVLFCSSPNRSLRVFPSLAPCLPLTFLGISFKPDFLSTFSISAQIP